MYFDVPGLIKSIDTSDFKDLTSQVIGDVLLNVHSLSKFGFLGEFVLMKIDFAVKGQIVTFLKRWHLNIVLETFLSRISLSHKKWLLFLSFLVTNFRFSGIGVGTKTMTSPILERFVTPEFCRTQENCFGLIITDAEIETEMGGGLF